ncbi:MAG: major facilitator superfamily transporter [Myxococcaceae bacterium]|nr:major facilitator superfamily transporter [Myxococcaceae bacterium]
MTTTAPAARRAAIGFIFVTALLDVMSLGLIIPVLPNLVKSFVGGDTASASRWVGLFGTSWALMQFVFSPVLGVVSDRFGRRPVILISVFGLGLDYVLMALAPSLGWLWLGRILSGITAASFSTAGAYIADVTPPEKRAQSFGVIGAAFGVGFVLGPALGGLLGDLSPRLPFWCAAGLALANGLYGLFVLPESLPPERRTAFRWAKANPFGAMKLLAKYEGLPTLGAVVFLYQLAHNVLPSIFVLYTGYRYHWSPRDVGVSLAATGVASIVVQTRLVGPAVRRLGERGALRVGLAAGALGFAIYGFAPTPLAYWMGLPVFALTGLIQPGVMGLMTRKVEGNEQGQLQGATSSIMGVTGLIGPGLFTTVFAWSIADAHMPGIAVLLAAVFMVAALAVTAKVGEAVPAAQRQ